MVLHWRPCKNLKNCFLSQRSSYKCQGKIFFVSSSPFKKYDAFWSDNYLIEGFFTNNEPVKMIRELAKTLNKYDYKIFSATMWQELRKQDRFETCFKNLLWNGACEIYSFRKKKKVRTSNDIIAGNGRVLKFYLFIVWLYLFNKIFLMFMIFSFSLSQCCI